MPVVDYSVLAAYPIKYHLKSTGNPHLQLFVDENQSADRGAYRAAINVRSSSTESRLVYWINRDFKHDIVQYLEDLPIGYTPIPSEAHRELKGLDYIRGNLVNFNDGKLLEYTSDPTDIDLVDIIQGIINNAIQQQAKVYLFGEPFPEREQDPDAPYEGIHNIHMNQGNKKPFTKDNGVFQDGGIIFSFPDGHWEAVFLAFGVQIIHTDDKDGSPIGDTDFVTLLSGEVVVVHPSDGKVIIEAALINPVGPDATPVEKEVVYIHNTTQQSVSLDGWTILNKAGETFELSGALGANAKGRYELPNNYLTNKGGIITLLDASGLKVDGVSYTKQQAAREGALLTFH